MSITLTQTPTANRQALAAPLRFAPQYHEKLWGGQKLKTVLGKDYGRLPNCGESWELSGVPGHESVVASGPLAGHTLPQLIEEYKEQLLGQSVYAQHGNQFPLLVKFIDAADDLSVQVHPNDELAQARHGCPGKTEMWYVLQADEGATLLSGWNQPVSATKYMDYFEQGRLMELLNRERVAPGDVFYLPAGRIHTIGKGIMLAEIQQTSDITYRLYDFDRTDAQGNKRQLHVEEALEALDFSHQTDYKWQLPWLQDTAVPLVRSPYFTTQRLWLHMAMARSLQSRDSFTIYLCVKGSAELNTGGHATTLHTGEVALVPACVPSVTLLPQGEEAVLLEAFLP